ncbi:MAG: hypothetical protein FWG27_03950 [Treponema sp.]|jgi:hypothetical protein|nr:hypothetical protein [Treponema sp.]
MKRNITTVQPPQAEVWLTAKPLLGKLIKWTTLGILVLALTTVTLYTAGSYRKDSDNSQLVLVRSFLTLSLLLIISSIYGVILNLYYAVRKRQGAYLFGVLGYVLIIVLGILIALGAAFILGAVDGNR